MRKNDNRKQENQEILGQVLRERLLSSIGLSIVRFLQFCRVIVRFESWSESQKWLQSFCDFLSIKSFPGCTGDSFVHFHRAIQSTPQQSPNGCDCFAIYSLQTLALFAPAPARGKGGGGGVMVARLIPPAVDYGLRTRTTIF